MQPKTVEVGEGNNAPLQETHKDEEELVVSEPTVGEEVEETTHEEQDPSLKQNENKGP